MYGPLQLAFKYLHYYFTSSNGKGHGTHSPFVFEFITKVLNDKKTYPGYQQVEDLRRKLMDDKTILQVEDMGAGSTASKTQQRSIASIARNAAKPPKYGQLLYRMVKHYQPQTILELGTSLGITTSYLSLAGPRSRVTTMEGASSVAALASKNFQSLQLNNVSLVEGNFDNTLETTISQLPSIDFCFVDGNHRREPTERYFGQILSKVHNNTILIFDDIHWSGEMERAWRNIQQHSSSRCTIDLFFIGIVLFRQEFKEKQHFAIRF